MAAVPMLRINVDVEPQGTSIFRALARELHVTDNFTLGTEC
jgi:hypothetical protein